MVTQSSLAFLSLSVFHSSSLTLRSHVSAFSDFFSRSFSRFFSHFFSHISLTCLSCPAAVNGVPSCANNWLLNDIARGEWGGAESPIYVTSDCTADEDVWNMHNCKFYHPLLHCTVPWFHSNI